MQRYAIVYKYFTNDTMWDKGHEKAEYGITFVKEYNYAKVMKLVLRKTNLKGRVVGVWKLDKDDPERIVRQIHGVPKDDPVAISKAKNAFKDITPRPLVGLQSKREALAAIITDKLIERINAKPKTKVWHPPYIIKKTQPVETTEVV